MKRIPALLTILLLLVLVPACFSGRRHGPEAAQENFGVSMARMNLWREALFRFKRAVEISPKDAQAHNNLAVAYEANGDFDAAAKEYREAMRLDKSNQYIQKNYSRLVEFVSRSKKRQQRSAPPAATTTASTQPVPGNVPTTSTAAPPQTTTAADAGKTPLPPTAGDLGGTGAPTAAKPAAVPPEATAPAPPPTDTAAAPPTTTTAPPRTDTAAPPSPRPPGAGGRP